MTKDAPIKKNKKFLRKDSLHPPLSSLLPFVPNYTSAPFFSTNISHPSSPVSFLEPDSSYPSLFQRQSSFGETEVERCKVVNTLYSIWFDKDNFYIEDVEAGKILSASNTQFRWLKEIYEFLCGLENGFLLQKVLMILKV